MVDGAMMKRAKMMEAIAKHGWAWIAFPGHVGFSAYSMGLSGHPGNKYDFIVRGLDLDVAQGCIARIAELVLDGTLHAAPGARTTNVFEETEVAFALPTRVDIDECWRVWEANPAAELLRVWWPDAAGRYPGEPLCDAQTVEEQSDAE